MPFNISEEKMWVTQYEKDLEWDWVTVFEKLATEPIKGEGRYIHGKSKRWKECIKTNFHGQDVPHDMYCNATAVLKIDYVYKQGKNYHPQVECKSVNISMPKTNNVTCWAMMMMMDFSRFKKKTKKIFAICLGLQN